LDGEEENELSHVFCCGFGLFSRPSHFSFKSVMSSLVSMDEVSSEEALVFKFNFLQSIP
jgi:hypothetical protein